MGMWVNPAQVKEADSSKMLGCGVTFVEDDKIKSLLEIITIIIICWRTYYTNNDFLYTVPLWCPAALVHHTVTPKARLNFKQPSCCCHCTKIFTTPLLHPKKMLHIFWRTGTVHNLQPHVKQYSHCSHVLSMCTP